jgi:hypothetical protein
MACLPLEMIERVMSLVPQLQLRDHKAAFAPCLETIEHRMVQIRAEGQYSWLISERQNYYAVLNDISPYTNVGRYRGRGRIRRGSDSEAEADTA